MNPALLFVIGASGAGKTAAVQALDGRALPGVRCHYFDSIGVPPPEIMERDFGAARFAGPRCQPELTTPRMDAWAVYLRGPSRAPQHLATKQKTPRH